MTHRRNEIESHYREKHPTLTPIPDLNLTYTIKDQFGVELGGFLAFNDDNKWDNHTLEFHGMPVGLTTLELAEKYGFSEFKVEDKIYNIAELKERREVKVRAFVEGALKQTGHLAGVEGSHKKDDANKPKYERIHPEFNAKLAEIMTEHPDVRLELIPIEAILALGKVFTFGAKKYGENNWRKCELYHRYIGATLRHFEAYRRGEANESKGEFHHLWHCLTNIAILIGLHAQKDKDNEKDCNTTK